MALPGYDAWKTASPYEALATCPRCGEETLVVDHTYRECWCEAEDCDYENGAD